MQTFTVVQSAEYEWKVLDGNGEERHVTLYQGRALDFAGLLLTQEQDYATRKAAVTFEEAPSFVSESYRRGQGSAYSHAHTRLSFLLGGTLPRGGAAFRQELKELSDKLQLWAVEHTLRADEIKTEREERINAKLDA
jgi:hypothetical protein